MAEEHSHKTETIRLLDMLGVGASSLCAVHCILTPIIIGFLPAIGARFLSNQVAHQFLAFWVIFFCLTAIVPGYLRHKRVSILTLMIIGLSFVLFATYFAAGTVGESWEVPCITLGNFTLIAAHLRNRKLACAMDHHH